MLALKFLLVACLLNQVWTRSVQDLDDFKLTILHVNDLHAHIDEVALYGGARCRAEDSAAGKCFGGAARMQTKIDEIRDQDPVHTLVLNAGDFYQGTIWYSLFKYEPVLRFSNMLGYNAMALGNHDFDDGVDGLVPFIEGANFEVLAANINATAAPELDRVCKKSVVLEIDGRLIGIIGYVTPSTASISNPGNVTFLSEIPSIQAEAKRLKSEGVEILIGLGHSGYEDDLVIAAKIPELDIVVGGHSHTFLWTGDKPPSVETVRGPYPTYVTQPSGKVVPVVQAYCYTKYVGRFDVHFDAAGELKTPVDGVGVTQASPILLDATVARDPEVERVIDTYRPNMTEYTRTIGITETKLRRNGLFESNLGDVIADSMAMSSEWSDTTIAFVSNTGIRADIEAGNVTGEDVVTVLPFANTIDRVVMSGEAIRTVLEKFSAGFCPNQTCYPGTFVQVSGLRIVYRIRADNVGHRVESLQTFCAERSIDNLVTADWCDVENESNYNIAITSYLAESGKFEFLEHKKGAKNDFDALVKHFETFSPINQATEGRLKFYFEED